MCGLVGAFSFNTKDFRITDSYLRPMRDVMEHRGPDGAGLWLSSDGQVGLGHRRLSIIDLSTAATQPMISADGQVVLTFNGEVYNHAEIRKELEALGITEWHSTSDTEVILNAYIQWGIECIEKFRGMFAFAIWDARTQEMYIVRDRIGIKPVYYTHTEDKFTFASEIKALLKDPNLKREINEEAFFHFLSFITTPAPMTLFKGISKLEPGTYLHIKDGNVTKTKWWDVLDATPEEITSETEATKKLMEELATAVKYRKVSDVQVGVFLSGGIDSSTNTALFSEEGKLPVKTFSMGYDAEYESCKNEFVYAREVAEMFNAEHFEKALTIDEMLDFLPRMVWLQDEPIADPVCVPVYFVSKLAKDNGVTVCQVGEGADELFCGYPSWMAKLKLAKWNSLPVPNFLKKGLLWGLAKAGKDDTFYYESLLRATKHQPIFWGGVDVFTDKHKHRLLSPRLREQFKGRSSYEVIEPIFNRYKQKSGNKFSWLSWMTYMDLNLRLPELLLMRVDKMSMGVSLEGRVPFLDHKFVEFAFHLPEKIKIAGGELKHILKKAVRGLIPDNIIDRKKQGFGMPVYEWYFDRLGDQTREILEEFCDETDFFDKEEVFKLVDSGKGSHIWYILNFALWWNHYIKPKKNADIQTVKAAA